MNDGISTTLDGVDVPEVHADDPMNCGFPCHPQVWGMTDDNADDLFKRQQRLTCPVCGSKFWGRFHQFPHPAGAKGVMEWASVRDGVTRVYPVPASMVAGCDSPYWSDLTFIPEPVGVSPLFASGFGLPEDRVSVTIGDLGRRGYRAVLQDAWAKTHGGYSVWKRDVFLVALAFPVTVAGRVVAEAGEVLLARSWWRVPGGQAVVVGFCPRLGRPVVLHHSFAVVPAPTVVPA